MLRVLVGLDVEGHLQRASRADRRVVGQREERESAPVRDRCRHGVEEPGQPAGDAGRPDREAFCRRVPMVAGEPQIFEMEAGDGISWVIPETVMPQPVVDPGADGDRNADRDVQGRDDEGEPGGLVFGPRLEHVDGRRPEEVVLASVRSSRGP